MPFTEPQGYELLRAAARRVERLVELAPSERSDFESDPALEERLTLRLVLAVQGCVSVAAELIAHYELQAGAGIAGLFECLVGQRLMPEELLPAFRAASSLRNRILFDVEHVVSLEVYKAALDLPPVLVEFLEAVSEQAVSTSA